MRGLGQVTSADGLYLGHSNTYSPERRQRSQHKQAITGTYPEPEAKTQGKDHKHRQDKTNRAHRDFAN